MKDTIYAQVLKGVVQNIIVLNDASLIPLFSQGYDFFIDITNLPQYPSPGDLYDGQNFTYPPIDYVSLLTNDIQNINNDTQLALDDSQSILDTASDSNLLSLAQTVQDQIQPISNQVAQATQAVQSTVSTITSSGTQTGGLGQSTQTKL